MKLDPLNQLFMTLIKLKLDLRERDLAHRFGVAVSVVFHYMGMLSTLPPSRSGMDA